MNSQNPAFNDKQYKIFRQMQEEYTEKKVSISSRAFGIQDMKERAE